MNTDFEDIPKIALDWHRAGKGAAIATVVQTWGSAPRPVGSLLAISGEAEIMGSVSGGCVEGAVVAEAIDTLEDEAPKLLTYGVSDNEAFAVGLACGGEIRILVEPVGAALPEALLSELVDARAALSPTAYVVDTMTWQRELKGMDAYPERFARDKSGFEDSRFVTIHNPPLRIAVVGGVHIAQHLIPMARGAGFAPVLIDPREAFASADRFPDTQIVHDWPDAAMDTFAPDSRSAIVTLTHDAKLDDPALQIALRSEAFYIGGLGSIRTHAKRVARLEEAGFSQTEIDRIHAPIGLDIGSQSPAEIAISIMAEIVQTLRKPA